MATLLVLLLLLAATATTAQVVTLDVDNFEHSTKQGVWFIKFYSPYCGHCIQMAPAWDQLAVKLQQDKVPVHVAQLDCTKDINKPITSLYDISRYPTLILLKDDKMYHYKGERTAEAFSVFAQKGYLDSQGSPRPHRDSSAAAAAAGAE